MYTSKFTIIAIIGLFLLVSFLSAQDQWNQNDFFKKEHSISKGASSGGVPFWDYVGSTIVTNKFIRLTSDSQSLQGALWNIVVSDLYIVVCISSRI